MKAERRAVDTDGSLEQNEDSSKSRIELKRSNTNQPLKHLPLLKARDNNVMYTVMYTGVYHGDPPHP